MIFKNVMKGEIYHFLNPTGTCLSNIIYFIIKNEDYDVPFQTLSSCLFLKGISPLISVEGSQFNIDFFFIILELALTNYDEHD